MIDPDLEPLAFKVLPRSGECFDSWIGRVAARHEVDRTELFRHLGIDPRLARCDLARGGNGIGGKESSDTIKLVDRLAWAMQVDGALIEATFVSAEMDMVLPSALRRFGCPLCWSEWLAAGEPLVILREWIFRIAWHCSRHHVLLADLRPVLHIVDRVARLRWLINAARTSSLMFCVDDYRPDLLELNQRALVRLQGGTTPGYAPLRAYLAEFGDNQVHVATSRIAILAGAHSHERHVPREFARVFPGLRCPGITALPAPAYGRPATHKNLVRAMVSVNRYRLRSKFRKLNEISRRLGRFAYLHAEKPGAWEQRARYQLERECRQRQSEQESLKSLQAALAFSNAAEERRRLSDILGPSGFPSAWGLTMPSVSRLRALIEAHPASWGGKTLADEVAMAKMADSP